MDRTGRERFALKRRLPLVCVLALLPFGGLQARDKKPAAPLYVFFLDQMPPQGAAPSINGLEERRRGPVFEAALRAASEAGGLPPVTVVNEDIHLPTTTMEKPKVPPGATLLRVFLTQWSNTRLGGFSDSELLCRFYVEVVRDGRTTAKLGPYLGRIPYDATAATTADSRFALFGTAARKGIDLMAHDLAR